MSSGCTAKEGALAYLKSTMQNKYYVEFAKSLSLVPGSTSAVADVPDYAPGGQFNIFFELSKQYAQLRPITPAYPFIATTFAKATQDILAGGDPKQVLDKAVKDIDNNIKSNGNYKF
jgi:multiple sugar transport system substrate-binding protein